MWNFLSFIPTVLGTTLIIAMSAYADQPSKAINASLSLRTDAATRGDKNSLSVFDQFSTSETTASISSGSVSQPTNFKISENDADDEMAQVNSVSQLSDVQPTDWAFQALQSLVKRYGCLRGYPDGTYWGNRAMTRYEFAASLDACLNRINQLTITKDDLVSRQDLATLQTLQQQFVKELATVHRRIDAAEVKATELQAHQFSTTTKLDATVVIAPVSVFAGDNAKGQKINTMPIFGDRVRLEFDTSFTGEDQLVTRLQATNLNALSATSTFTPEGDLRFGGYGYSTGNNNNIFIDTLSYAFPLDKNTKVIIEGYSGTADDFADTVNPFLDGDGDTGALSNFGTHNPIYNLVVGSGVIVNHDFSDNLELTLGYLADNSNDPEQKNGLFNGSYGGMGQLTIKPSENFSLGLTYVNSYNADLTAGSNRANLHSALLSDNSFLPNAALESLRGQSLPVSSNSYGLEASFQLSPNFALGGWAGYTNERLLSTLGGIIPRGNLDIWNYAVTLAFPDLGNEGSLGGIIVGMEPRVTGVSSSLRSVIGKDKDVSLHIEGLYQYKLSDNITITPGVIWLIAPDDNSNNTGVVIGTVRTTFTF